MMDWDDMVAWVEQGGYTFLPTSFPTWGTGTKCLVWNTVGNALHLFDGDVDQGSYTPSLNEAASTQWMHSDQHTDKPPRT